MPPSKDPDMRLAVGISVTPDDEGRLVVPGIAFVVLVFLVEVEVFVVLVLVAVVLVVVLV